MSTGLNANLADQVDFDRWLVEYGFTRASISAAISNVADQIPMPAAFAYVTVRPSPIDGLGLFTSKPMWPGDVIAPARLSRMRTPAGRYTNHSVSPNAEFIRLGDAPDADMDLVAICEIAPNEEVTVCYRQAGRVNGNGIKPNPDEVAKTLRLRSVTSNQL